MPNVFSPGTGFAQSQYVDQQATALPGALAFASDERLVDSYIVAASVGPDGLEAGLGVVATVLSADEHNGQREGMNTKFAALPAAGNTADAFEGITVRNQQMDTNANGHACWFAGRMCNVLRAKRVGGRVWVLLSNGSSTIDGTVYWIISDTTSHGKPIGSFSSAALGADTVELTNARFKSNSDASSNSVIALVELAEEA
jgi:hypothetical protein